MKLYHMAPKPGGKSDNFAITTDEQWNLELPTMLAVEAKDSPGRNHQGQGRGVTTKVDSLAGLGNDFNSGDQPVGLSSDEGAVQATSEGGNLTDVTFVDDCIVEVAFGRVRTYADEYETGSENDFSDLEDEDVTPVTVSRSGRPIRAQFCLDF